MIDLVKFSAFVEKKRIDDEGIFSIWLRCINGDKENERHSGNRARYPRERMLLKRVVNLVNSWSVSSENIVPSLKEFEEFVVSESDNMKLDAVYVDRRCVRGNPDHPEKKYRYPREKAMLRRILQSLRWFQASLPTERNIT